MTDRVPIKSLQSQLLFGITRCWAIVRLFALRRRNGYQSSILFSRGSHTKKPRGWRGFYMLDLFLDFKQHFAPQIYTP
jgi:hypothetical protein